MFRQYVNFNDAFKFVMNIVQPIYDNVLNDVRPIGTNIRTSEELIEFVHNEAIAIVERFEKVIRYKSAHLLDYDRIARQWDKQPFRLSFDSCVLFIEIYYDMLDRPLLQVDKQLNLHRE